MQKGDLEILLKGVKLLLLREKAIWWAAKNALILSDIHFGKAAHFRKHGLPLSQKAQNTDNERLAGIIEYFKPARVIILGDLFHSQYNRDWERLINFTAYYGDVRFQLVPGNHDILASAEYQRAGLEIFDTVHEEGPFAFIHDFENETLSKGFMVCGHLHPAIILRGTARQSLSLPAFVLDDRKLCLPAFGSLTGLYSMEKEAFKEVFVVGPEGVFAMKGGK